MRVIQNLMITGLLKFFLLNGLNKEKTSFR